ncbi:MAG: hypothetical protein H6628_19920 [Calditrichae bacterium]|nr:hypothetical protein [Calditrichia bacterium]
MDFLSNLQTQKKIISILVLFIAFQLLPIYLQVSNYTSWVILYEITLLYAITSTITHMFSQDSSAELIASMRLSLLLFVITNALVWAIYFLLFPAAPDLLEIVIPFAGQRNPGIWMQLLPLLHTLVAAAVIMIFAVIKRSRLNSAKAT